MTMKEDALTMAQPEDIETIRESVTAVAALNKSEVEAQLDAAHKYPRSITRFKNKAFELATLTPEIAMSCIYSLKRRDTDGQEKIITGPSIRMAEICASAYGNLHFGGRVVEEGDKTVTAQGVCWDLEVNNRAVIEAQRRITNRSGRRYGDDMVIVTSNAATAIALRNAIFKVIPRAYINELFGRVKEALIGKDVKLFAVKRQELFDRLAVMGVTADRVLAVTGKKGIDDVGADDVTNLIGLGTAIKTGDVTIEEAFPAVGATTPVPGAASGAPDGRRMSLVKPPVQQQGGGGAGAAAGATASTDQPASQGQGGTAPTDASTPETTPPPPAQQQQQPTGSRRRAAKSTKPDEPADHEPPADAKLAMDDVPTSPATTSPVDHAASTTTAGAPTGPSCLVCHTPVPGDKAAWEERANGWRHVGCVMPTTSTEPTS